MKVSLIAWQSLRRRRAVLFRVMAVILGLLPFLVIEVVLRASGVGQPDLHDDPFVEFSGVRPLFELNEAGERFEIARSRQLHFVPDSFAAHKPPGEFRVFCIGDSTVQGNPWSTETSFTTWLEISLNSADPSRHWDVINCGGISYASYRMVPILEEVLRYQPDLVIVHCSHNEFLEDRTYGRLKQTPRLVGKFHSQILQLRLYNVLRTAAQSVSGQSVSRQSAMSLSSRFDGMDATTAQDPRPVLPAEVEAILDCRGGLEFYHRDESWRRDVIEHYEFNLRRMTSLAHQAGVALILMNPAAHLRNSPPFKAEHRSGLTERERRQWDGLWTEARAHYASHPRRAAQLLREALAIDDQHAGLHYDLAKCYDALGQFADARAEYIQAKELDVCPLRILEPMNDIVCEVGRDTNTPVVDVRALFDRLSRNGIPGSEWFADHVHPTIPGYQHMADELGDAMQRLGMVHPHPEWLERRELRFNEHLNSLPNLYFVHAQERLKSLMLWANGRATKEWRDLLTRPGAAQSAPGSSGPSPTAHPAPLEQTNRSKTASP